MSMHPFKHVHMKTYMCMHSLLTHRNACIDQHPCRVAYNHLFQGIKCPLLDSALLTWALSVHAVTSLCAGTRCSCCLSSSVNFPGMTDRSSPPLPPLRFFHQDGQSWQKWHPTVTGVSSPPRPWQPLTCSASVILGISPSRKHVAVRASMFSFLSSVLLKPPVSVLPC